MGKRIKAVGTGIKGTWDKIFTLTACTALGAALVWTLISPIYWWVGGLAGLSGRLLKHVEIRW